MAQHRIATYSVDSSIKYGAVVEGGIVDLSARFAKDYLTLREATAAGAATAKSRALASPSRWACVDLAT